MEFMILCHAMQRNKARQGTSSHDLVRRQLVLPTIERLGIIAEGWPQMKLVKTKIISSPLCILLMTQRSHNFFTKLKYRAFFSTTYGPSELYLSKSSNHHNQVLEDACGKYDHGVAELSCYLTLHTWLCFEDEIWREMDKTSMDAAEFSDTLVEASRHPKFIWNRLLKMISFAELGFKNELKLGYFSPFLTKFWWKVRFWSQIQ